MPYNLGSREVSLKKLGFKTDISQLVVLASRTGAAVHTCTVQLTDNIDKALDIKEAPQVETKYALMRPEEVSHQKQLDGYITVDQPVRNSVLTVSIKCSSSVLNS
jgi:hypothetical protein